MESRERVCDLANTISAKPFKESRVKVSLLQQSIFYVKFTTATIQYALLTPVVNEQEHFRQAGEWGLKHAISKPVGVCILRKIADL